MFKNFVHCVASIILGLTFASANAWGQNDPTPPPVPLPAVPMPDGTIALPPGVMIVTTSAKPDDIVVVPASFALKADTILSIKPGMVLQDLEIIGEKNIPLPGGVKVDGNTVPFGAELIPGRMYDLEFTSSGSVEFEKDTIIKAGSRIQLKDLPTSNAPTSDRVEMNGVSVPASTPLTAAHLTALEVRLAVLEGKMANIAATADAANNKSDRAVRLANEALSATAGLKESMAALQAQFQRPATTVATTVYAQPQQPRYQLVWCPQRGVYVYQQVQ